MQYFVALLLVFLLTFYMVESKNHEQIQATAPTPSPLLPANKLPDVLGSQVKTSDCHMQNGLQDKDCTPGDIFPNVAVDQICTKGYTKSVRNVSSAVKKKVYTEYGITSHKRREYEVDHLISLELGGSNDISNLWPQPAEPKPGYHEKDIAENFLNEQLCNGSMTLKEVQDAIRTDWISAYKNVPDKSNYDFNNSDEIKIIK
jgi:hypothetical protein